MCWNCMYIYQLNITITSKGRCHICFIGGTHNIQDVYIFKGNTASAKAKSPISYFPKCTFPLSGL